jgi:predicted dehydrogenase
MTTTYRVGISGLVHDHVWGEIDRWLAIPNAQIVAAGDVNANLRDKIAAKVPGIRLYATWQEMIEAERGNLDILQIAAENNVHADMVEAASGFVKAIITEKPLAATYAQAKRIATATESAGISFLVNWPTAWFPAFQELERRLLAGEIGVVRYFKYRSAHNGPKEIGCDPHFYEWLYDGEKNGAGAYMDYICYGAAMCARILGRPKKVTGLRAVLAKDYPLPDDNAVVTMLYDHAMGVAEASWTQVTGYVGPNPIAYGSEGALAVDLKNGQLHLHRPGKPVEIITPAPTEFPLRSGPEYLIHCLDTGMKPEGVCSLEVGLIAQEILEAGLRAADTGQTQILPLES